jgi:hypothetical protein
VRSIGGAAPRVLPRVCRRHCNCKPGFLKTLAQRRSNKPQTPNPKEDAGEALEPALEPLLARALFRVGGRLTIRLGDADVDYDKNFRWGLGALAELLPMHKETPVLDSLPFFGPPRRVWQLKSRAVRAACNPPNLPAPPRRPYQAVHHHQAVQPALPA